MGVPFFGVLFAGILMLGFVARPRWVHVLGRLLTLGLALASTTSTVLLYRFGHAHHWTGDGPGMLLVMLGVGVIGICAVAAWLSVITQGVVASRSIADALNDVHRRVAVIAIATGLLGIGYEARESRLTQKPAHDAPVTALRFAKHGALLASLDRAGTLKTWDVATKSLLHVRSDPTLAEAYELLLAPDGKVALALVSGGARLFRPGEPDAPALLLPGVTHVALLEDGDVALADIGGVRRASLPSPDRVRWARSLPARVTALAADEDERLVAALEDGRLMTLERDGSIGREIARLPAAAQRLSRSPGGTWLVATDAAGRGYVIGPHGESTRPLPEWMRLDRVAFTRDDVLVFAGEGDPSALALRLARLESEPWLNHGGAVTALDAATGAHDAALALAGELLLAPAPGKGHAYTSESTRLVHRRP